MKDFKKTVSTQVVAFNNEHPEKQVVTKEDVTITTSYLWGLIKITDIKDITQTYGNNTKKVGY